MEEQRDREIRLNSKSKQIIEPWRNYYSIHASDQEKAGTIIHWLNLPANHKPNAITSDLKIGDEGIIFTLINLYVGRNSKANVKEVKVPMTNYLKMELGQISAAQYNSVSYITIVSRCQIQAQ